MVASERSFASRQVTSAREEMLEQLGNIAIRIHSFGPSMTSSPPESIRRALAEALAGLRRASLRVVEEFAAWKAERGRLAIQKAEQDKRGREEARRLRQLAAAQRKQATQGGGASKKKPPPAAGKDPARRRSLGVRPLSEVRKDVRAAEEKSLFSSYSLRYACSKPSGLTRPRDAPGLWDGLNYLLKMLTDVWTVPLPTASDPFVLFFHEAHSPFSFESAVEGGLHLPEERERMLLAERALKRLVSQSQYNKITALEAAIGLRQNVAHAQAATTQASALAPLPLSERTMAEEAVAARWRQLALILHPAEGGQNGGAAGFWGRKRWQAQVEAGVCRLQMSFRIHLLRDRVRQRILERKEDAARFVQKMYREKLLTSATANAFANVALDARTAHAVQEARLQAARLAQVRRLLVSR